MTDLGALGSQGGAVIDVTDATFEQEVMLRSQSTPVVVDLWAPWCGPCKTLGPILEEVVGATDGRVVLAKVNVDENPAIAGAFQVQSIPAVYAVSEAKVVDGFMGAVGRAEVEAFIDRLSPSAEDDMVAALVAARDELGLRAALETHPGDESIVVTLAEILVERGETEEALALLERVPETDRVRHVKAEARLGTVAPDDDYDERLTELLDRVKDDDEARQTFVDILELMGPNDPRTAAYRKQLTARLF